MIIWLLLLIGLTLRLINLNQSLWLDEAVQAITAQKSFSYIFQEITGDFRPPLYHFLMHFWVRIFGSSEIALRTPSVFFGVGTICLVYKINGLWKGIPRLVSFARNDNKSSWIAALFMATAPFHIYYSQEARMYPMVTFFSALSMFFFLKTNEHKKYQLLYFITTLLMLYSDYYGFLVLLAQGIFLLTRRKYKFLLITYLLSLIAYLPWLSMFITQIKIGILATQSLPEWGRLVNVSFLKAIPLTLVKFSLGRITIFDKKLYACVIAAICLLFGGLLIRTINGYLKERSKDDKGAVVLWFFVPLIISWLASLFIPNFQPFRLLLILPAFYLLLADEVQKFKSPIIQKLFIALILSVNLISLGVYYFNPYFQREGWKGLTVFLKKEEAIVVLPSSASNWPIKYYDPKGSIGMIYGTDGAIQVSEKRKIAKKEDKQIYYIRYLVPVFDPQEKILASLEKEGYTKTKELSFNQILVWEFQKR